MKKRIIATILTGVVTVSALAQVSKTLSPYSQFGLGTLADQSLSVSRGMGGVGLAMRDGKAVNMLNPASYSAVDSLTMIFDMGVSGQITNFKEGGRKMNRNTADFDYAVALFRIMPKMGVSFGIVPFTNVGYNYYNTSRSEENPNLTLTNQYTGTGGLSQAFLGVGYEVLKGLSVGANLSYLWGDFSRTVTNTSNESYAKVLTKTYSATINSYKLDFGVQYQHAIDKNNLLTVGATVGLGHHLGANANLASVTSEPLTGTSFSTTDSVPDAYSIPFSVGAGVNLVHKNSWTFELDYALQKWSSLASPMQTSAITADHQLGYQSVNGMLIDRHKVNIGADWIPEPNTLSRRSIFRRTHYRIGASYATPYYKISDQNGPRELSVSAGVGIPIVNSWNNRSVLNISAQWVNTSSSHFITENTFRINIGLTFNERWFAKWKVD